VHGWAQHVSLRWRLIFHSGDTQRVSYVTASARDVTQQNRLSRAPACSIVTDPLIEDRSINRIFDSSTWRRIDAQRQWHATKPLNVLSSQLTHANSLIFARGLTHNYYDEIWQFIRRPMTEWLVDLVQLEWSWVNGHTGLLLQWVSRSFSDVPCNNRIIKAVYNCLYTVSQKMCKIVFVRTSSNFHQFWQFLAESWKRG